MAESPEVPEAKDPFEKKIALSIAIVAVLLALIGAKGDSAKTEAIIKTNKSSDAWGEYQAKKIKQHVVETNVQVLEKLGAMERQLNLAKPEAAAPQEGKPEKPAKGEKERATKTAEDYAKEAEPLKEKAQDFTKEADSELETEKHLHLAEVLLQLAVVLSSIAILTRWHVPWFVGMVLAAGGAIYGAMHYF